MSCPHALFLGELNLRWMRRK